MKTNKQLGIWMDYATAYVMELKGDTVVTTEVESEFTFDVKNQTTFKNENLMHNKENHLRAAYFKEISNLIIGFNEVILFGPSDAKAELFNRLSADPQFKNVKWDMQTADKMTTNQRQAFVRNYFITTVEELRK